MIVFSQFSSPFTRIIQFSVTWVEARIFFFADASVLEVKNSLIFFFRSVINYCSLNTSDFNVETNDAHTMLDLILKRLSWNLRFSSQVYTEKQMLFSSGHLRITPNVLAQVSVDKGFA